MKIEIVNRVQGWLRRTLKLAVLVTIVIWLTANSILNKALEHASREMLPFVIATESVTMIIYIIGVALMLYGIGRDVTWRNILAFDLRQFEPETNRCYRVGFWLNRLAAFSFLYILVGLLVCRVNISIVVWLICLADLTGTVYVTLNLTRWLKMLKGKRAGP